ncbi:hypothetical protein ABRZ10_07225 [Castellaniella ginsengisoli]|uniref:DUF3144 domain-containing protein n=1 Tax=Castellaniella ginsengisoli TaxID=546114 RepID=A0AB39FA23_9BURK
MSNKPETPAAQIEAEEFAKQAVQQYLNACRMSNRNQMGNYLMKLCSVAGVMMALAEGSEDAAQRLEATAAFIRRKMPDTPARMEPLQ